MGKRGPAKTPTKWAVLMGGRADRINTNEPQPSDTPPGDAGDCPIDPPSWLTQRAKNVWKQYAPDLHKVGVLTLWDVEAFAAWCDAVVRRREAIAQIRKDGAVMEFTVFNKNGQPSGTRVAKNPWTYVLNDADAHFRYYAARFGLTPSDRAQLTLGEAPGEPGEDLLEHG